VKDALRIAKTKQSILTAVISTAERIGQLDLILKMRQLYVVVVIFI